MNDWLNIESAPKDGKACLVSNGDYVLRAYFNPYPLIWGTSEEHGCWTVHEPEDYLYAWHLNKEPPTHWMPLPSPSKKKYVDKSKHNSDSV